MQEWKNRTTLSKICLVLRMILSVVVLVTASLYLLGMWEPGLSVAVPLGGAAMLLAAVEDWKVNRVGAMISLLVGLFITGCASAVFFLH